MSLEKPSQDSSPQPSPEASARKRPVSERRIQANRRNALRSTGPKTARGKRTVARNAIKHGLLAREVVITAGDGKETPEEFHALVERLYESYEPVGGVEEMLVQAIATCWWRKARIIRAENGEIRRRLDMVRVDRELRNSDKVNLALASWKESMSLYNADNSVMWSARAGLAAMQHVLSDLREHSSGLKGMGERLLLAKSEIENDGYISEEVREQVSSAFCLLDNEFASRICSSLRPPDDEAEGQPSGGVEDKEAEKKRACLIECIDDQVKRLRELEKLAWKREELAADAEARAVSLPPADSADKLLRYESHLDRQLYRAMDQLERLQRQRRGENVPPPLNVNLGSRRN